MMRKLLLILLVLLVPALADAQYAPNRFDVVREVAEQHPGLILRDHEFTNRVVLELRARYPQEGWCRNAKRGNFSDPSHDAIWMPDARSPIGGSIIDIIGSAGAANASPAWIDQTAETIRQGTRGGCIEPTGSLPSAPGGGPGEPVTPAPTPSPAPAPDYRAEIAALTAAVAALRSDVAILRAEASGIRSEAANAHESIYRLISETLIAEHLDDIKRRIDAVQQQIGQQSSSRPAPRWPW
jgi:hypothetical protein